MAKSFGNGMQFTLIGLMGILTGCVSAYAFSTTFFFFQDGLSPEQQLLSYVPGLVFGIAVAIVYVYTERRFALRLLGAIAIPMQGLITYQIAYWITEILVTEAVRPNGLSDNSDPTLFVAPFAAALGGFIGTLIFVFLLHVLTRKYSARRQFFLSLWGGLFGGLLIDAIFLPNTLPGRTIGEYIFFIGWQTAMLLIVSRPLLKKSDEVVDKVITPTSTITTGPVAQPQTRTVPTQPIVVAPDSYLLQYILIAVAILVPVGIFIEVHGVAGYTISSVLSNPSNPQPIPIESYEDRPSQLPAFIDQATYRILSDDHSTYIYAKDKSNVYLVGIEATYDPKAANGPYKMEKIEGADAATFDLVEDEKGSIYNASYARDKNHVYWGTRIVVGADPATFVSYYTNYENQIPDSLAKDTRHVYLSGKLIMGADPGSFTIITKDKVIQPYAKDKYRLYVASSVSSDGSISGDINGFVPVPNSDPKTFTWVPADTTSYKPTYAKDKNVVYFNGTVLQGANALAFVTLDHYPSRCDTGYYASEVFKRLKRETGVDTPRADAKDRQHCWNHGKLVPYSNGEPASLQFVKNRWGGVPGFMKDDNRVYRWSLDFGDDGTPFLVLPNSDPRTFVMLDTTYAKDKNNVYMTAIVEGMESGGIPPIVQGADPSTFIEINEPGPRDGKDKNHFYWHGKVVE